MDHLVQPILLYSGCALGALGIAIALPKKSSSPFIVGAILAAAAFGLIMLGLGLKNPEQVPNYHFYIFSLIALGGAMRLITHPRPVYAALYFVLTILASSGLYLILSAEFMTFALIIVYAGAILITYLFVIMLATESPTEEQPDVLNEYDRRSREPIVATFAGFVLLGGLTTLFAVGLPDFKPDPKLAGGDRQLGFMPRKVEPILRDAGLLKEGEHVVAVASPHTIDGVVASGSPSIENITIKGANGVDRLLPRDHWPANLKLSNTEGVAFTLIDAHPGAIEIAGVILLMAMLGAVVLARKKVEMDEAAKVAAAHREHSGGGPAPDELGIEGPYVTPGVGEGGAA